MHGAAHVSVSVTARWGMKPRPVIRTRQPRAATFGAMPTAADPGGGEAATERRSGCEVADGRVGGVAEQRVATSSPRAA